MTAQRDARSDPSLPDDLGPADRPIAVGIEVQENAQRQVPFSYRCNGCSRCCYNKLIQLNPYEIARLARNRGMDSGEFLSAYTGAGGSVLTQQAGGACVFLRAGGCSVHPDRPLVCRLYPLGRYVERDDTETFVHIEPHPETEGEYGEDGTVADFLDQQQAAPFLAAADRYFALFNDVVALLQRRLGERPSDVPDVMANLDQPGVDGEPVAWYDIDRIVADHAAGTGAPRPSSPEDKMTTHIEALRTWASLPDEEKTHGPSQER